MRYRMIGLDLDGTLLGSEGRASGANLAAVAAAQRAGVVVVPATGRAWREARFAIAQFPNPDLGIFVGGAVVARLETGESLDLGVLEPHLALEMIQHLARLPESVLVFQERSLVGHDYLVTGRGTLTANTQWWFQMTGAKVHFLRSPTVDDLRHTLRVGVVASSQSIGHVMADLEHRVVGRVNLHSFKAIAGEAHEDVHIVEIFALGVDKWRGLDWIARQRGIQPSEIVMIGDEINDVAALVQAGCGIAMANAPDSVKAAADHVTLSCDEDGVAVAIGKLLSGEW